MMIPSFVLKIVIPCDIQIKMIFKQNFLYLPPKSQKAKKKKKKKKIKERKQKKKRKPSSPGLIFIFHDFNASDNSVNKIFPSIFFTSEFDNFIEFSPIIISIGLSLILLFSSYILSYKTAVDCFKHL